MQNDLPFFDSPEDALRAAVQQLGGAKKVAPILWGADRSVEQATRSLLDCLNHDRAEKLSISQVMQILRMARDAGYHAPMLWFAAELGYDAHPITKAEEVDRVTTAIEHASELLAAGLAAMERIQRTGIVKTVRRA